MVKWKWKCVISFCNFVTYFSHFSQFDPRNVFDLTYILKLILITFRDCVYLEKSTKGHSVAWHQGLPPASHNPLKTAYKLKASHVSLLHSALHFTFNAKS